MTKRPLSDTAVALLVIAGGLLLYVPFAGSYGLWDPWETHYAEVARQMTHRGDYISLWWPGSPRDPEVFWSKPVLSFWLMSLTMRLFGIGLPGNPAGAMAMALALGALALFQTEDDVRELPRRGRGWWSWPHDPLFYATVALFAVAVVPQLIVNAVQLRVEVPWGERVFVMYGAVPMIP